VQSVDTLDDAIAAMSRILRDPAQAQALSRKR
jgi:hypothetical protein